MGIRYCPKCGNRAEDSDLYCIHCGARLASGGMEASTARPSGTASGSTGTTKPAGAAKKSSTGKQSAFGTIVGILIVAAIVLGTGWYMFGRSDITGTWRGYLEGNETVLTFWDDGTGSVYMAGGSETASVEYEFENGYLQFRALYGDGYMSTQQVPCKIKGKTMIWSDPYTGEEVTFKKD